jgi:hypothetical protein
MSSGKRTFWRLLSPIAVVMWVVATVGLATAAYADETSDQPAGTSTAKVGSHESQPVADAGAAPAVPAPNEHADAASAQGTAHGGTSGDVTEPQPISNADANTGGANGQCPDGPYCSTRDGSASGNGNGGGNATGEPCAGCVGKADNKNPAGQMPDASDSNAGYECDTNHGIARSNPAHTGCVLPPEGECVPTETVPCEQPPECVPTETVPCEQPPECVPTDANPCVSPPECVPTEAEPCVSPPLVSPPTPPRAAAAVTPQVLPNTGAPADLVELGVAAVASLVVGSIMLLGRSRRIREADAR